MRLRTSDLRGWCGGPKDSSVDSLRCLFHWESKETEFSVGMNKRPNNFHRVNAKNVTTKIVTIRLGNLKDATILI